MANRDPVSNNWLFLVTWLCLTANIEAVLHRASLANDPRAVCSDGTHAAYYRSQLEQGDSRTNFVIFLEGGGYCHDVNACDWRCNMAPHLCTTPTADTFTTTGILADSLDENPHFHDYFKVDLPYCTSDMYIGRRAASMATKDHHFQGRRVFLAMLKALVEEASLSGAQRILLTGSSAGGAGVAFNCEFLKKFVPKAEVYCVVDAAFFYPLTEPFQPDVPCESIDKVLRVGGNLWNSPEAANLKLKGWWKYIKQNLFIGTARYDQFGIESFCGMENSTDDLDLWGNGIRNMARDVMRFYPHIGLFIPGCIRHMMLTDADAFQGLPVGERRVTYSETLQNWIQKSGQIHTIDQCSDGSDTCQIYC